MFRPILTALLLMAAPVAGHAQSIVVDQPWARATAPQAMAGGVFMTLTGSGAADKLIGVSSPVAGEAQLHRTVAEAGVMKMLPVAAIDLEPGKTVTLAPGGYHVMLMGLKQQLKPGDTFPVTLTFAKAAPMTVMATVGAAGAAGPAGAAHAMPGMPAMPGMSGMPAATKP